MKTIIRYAFYILLLFNSIAYAQAPVITAFTPTSGIPGITVIITGANFDTTPANNMVLFGAVKASVTAATTTQLTVTVPAGALYQSISVLNLTTGLTAVSSQQFLPVFNSCGNLTTGSFSPKVEFPHGSSSNSLISSDIDGDGKGDLVTNGMNYFYISRNMSIAGSISFGGPLYYAVEQGSTFTGVAVGDLTGDGKPEVVVPNPTTHNITIRKNGSTPGSVIFGSQLVFSSSVSNPNNATIGDIDGDGKNDVIIISNTGASILRNTTIDGIISFAPAVPLSLGFGNDPGNASLADIDGDGKTDIVLDGNALFVFRNTSTPGSITLSAVQMFTSATNCSGLSTGDVDDDGKLDVLVVNASTTSMSIFRNTSTSGTINFASRSDYATAASPNNVNLGDMDGDHKPDIMVMNYGLLFSVLKNTSTPGSLSIGLHIDYSSGGTRSGIVGDYDYDNQPDILAITQASNIAAFKNIAACMPPSITSFSPATSLIGSTITITGTNFNTIAGNNVVFFGATRATVITETATQLTVTVPYGSTRDPISVTDLTSGLTAYSSIPFQQIFDCGASVSVTSFAPKIDISASVNYMVFKDFDGDGKPDMSLAKANSTIAVYRNSSLGSISFDAPVTLTIPGASGIILSEDVNGDGKPDLINWSQTQYLSVHKNTSTVGSLSFEPRFDIDLGYDNLLQGLHDFDGDGRADAITFDSWDNDNFRILKNVSTRDVPSFMQVVSIPVTNIISQKVADMDGDGKPDILISRQPNIISFYKNTTPIGGAISFAPMVDFTTDLPPSYLNASDVDGDGKTDILYISSSSSSSNKVCVLRNTTASGVVSFAPKTEFSTAVYPRGFMLNDLDGDGKPEVAVSSGSPNNKVVVFKNNSVPGTISFAAYVDFGVGSNPSAVFGVDLTVNGKADIITQNGTNSISFLSNITPHSVTGGIVATNQTICPNGDPAAFTQTTASTGPGTLSFQWQSSPDNITYSNIGGATSTTYNAPAGVAQTTYYQRLTSASQNGITCSASSNPITITVASVTGGSVGANQAICSGGNPAAFTQTSAASGPGTLTYQWQKSTNGTSFSNITGATATTYDAPSGLTQTTYYKRVVTASSGNCTAESNSVTVTVSSVSTPSISQTGSVCDQYVTLKALPNGAASYIWSTGYNGQIVNMISSGTYTVTATYSNGCSRTSGSYSAILIPAMIRLHAQSHVTTHR